MKKKKKSFVGHGLAYMCWDIYTDILGSSKFYKAHLTYLFSNLKRSERRASTLSHECMSTGTMFDMTRNKI
jgi:hypothetical protein